MASRRNSSSAAVSAATAATAATSRFGCFLLLVAAVFSSRALGLQEFCNYQTFYGSCQPNEVIVMESARYGRMSMGPCVKNNLGYIGCVRDALNFVDSRCSGHRSCEIALPDPALDEINPCLDDLKSYLEVEYKCLNVITPEPESCEAPIPILESEGYIASVVTDETGCGSQHAPWRITGRPGQTVELTLLDFSMTFELGELSESSHCPVFATIQELDRGVDKVICGGHGREEWVYTSSGNVIDVMLPKQDDTVDRRHYLLKYKIDGCSSPKVAGSMRLQRKGKLATIKCLSSGRVWTLECKNRAWTGKLGNCSATVISPDSPLRLGGISLSTGLTITIIVGVSVLIGGSILLLGLVCLRKSRKNQHHDGRCEDVLYDKGLKSSPHQSEICLPLNEAPPESRVLRVHDGKDYAVWEWPSQGAHYTVHSELASCMYAVKQECQYCQGSDQNNYACQAGKLHQSPSGLQAAHSSAAVHAVTAQASANDDAPTQPCTAVPPSSGATDRSHHHQQQPLQPDAALVLIDTGNKAVAKCKERTKSGPDLLSFKGKV